jgi:hypothetical protein
MFRGEDATGLDVLDEPLVRARLADATTISECTSRTALRLKMFLLASLCLVWAGDLRAEVFAVVRGDVFYPLLQFI